MGNAVDAQQPRAVGISASAAALDILAEMQHLRAFFDKAQATFERKRDLVEGLDKASTLCCMAMIMRKRGMQAAEEHLLEALKIMEARLGDHADVARLLMLISEGMGDRRALPLRERALHITSMSPNDPGVADMHANALELFAKSCYAHSRYKEAEDLFAQASRAREKLHQPALPESLSLVVDGGLRVPPSIGHTVPDAMMFDPDVQRSVNNVAAAGAAAVKHDRKRRRRAKKKRQARAAARAAAIKRDDHRYLMSRPRRMTSL